MPKCGGLVISSRPLRSHRLTIGNIGVIQGAEGTSENGWPVYEFTRW